MISQLNAPVTKKRVAAAIAVIAIAALLGWGGWTLYGRLTGRPQTTSQVRRAIWKYLAKQCGDRHFTPAIDLAKASVGDSTPLTVTNKAGKVKTVTKASKVGNLMLPETTLSAYFRTNQQAASSYERMYRLIGEQLHVTENLLDEPDTTKRLTGIVMACEAGDYARTNAVNVWLAARISEAYLWPNIPFVETNQAVVTADAVLNICDMSFKDAGETNNIIRNYELILARNQRTPAQLDAARFRLAQVYIDLEEKEKALKLLKEIKNIKTAKLALEISMLEREIADRKQFAEKKQSAAKKP